MTDHFDPRLVQADYLRQAGFRDLLVAHLQAAMGITGPSYLFSKENEEARMTSSMWLQDVLTATGFIAHVRAAQHRPTSSLWPAANRLISHYELGAQITREELGLDQT